MAKNLNLFQSTISNIANVVLSGINPTSDKNIYKIGINILKNISGVYKPPLKTITTTVGEDADATAVRKTYIIPVFQDNNE